MNMSTAQEFKCLNSDHYNTPHAVWKQRFCCSVAKLSDCRTPGSCPPICPGVCFYSRPLIQWHYLTISSSAALFSFCFLYFPAFGSFPMSQLFASGGQSTGASAQASILPINIQGWFPLGLTGLTCFQSKGLSSLLQHHSSETSILQCWAFFMVQLSHAYMTTGKTIALTKQTFVDKVMSLLFNMLFVISFLPRSQCQLISWLQSLSTAILEPNKVCHHFTFFLFAKKWWDQMPWS